MERESQQQPAEEVTEQHDEQPATAQEPQHEPEASIGEEPIYEFPPDSSQAQAQSPASEPFRPEQRVGDVPVEEAVQRGWVYPPPPSYYQNMPVSVERPPISSGRPAGIAGPPSSPYGAGTQTLPPSYAPPAQGIAAHPEQKRSQKWVWVVVAILSLALVVSCGLCGWGFYGIFNTSLQTATGVLGVVDSYYSAIKSQNYGAAYQDLAPQASINGLSEQDFIQQAQQRDQQYGQVTSYATGQPSFVTNPTTGPDLSRMTITVNVQRANLNYAVVLSLSKVGENWKITDFDRI